MIGAVVEDAVTAKRLAAMRGVTERTARRWLVALEEMYGSRFVIRRGKRERVITRQALTKLGAVATSRRKSTDGEADLTFEELACEVFGVRRTLENHERRIRAVEFAQRNAL